MEWVKKLYKLKGIRKGPTRREKYVEFGDKIFCELWEMGG